jgi:maltose alpha-D-glucosyltransferase/alpha-amylase
VAEEDRHPITDIMAQTPDIPDNCQWAIFLRNHDELTLEMVTERERDYMYRTYASDARMRINLGIRRRLAPLMDNNRRKIELLNSLLMSVIGSPVLYYGDEIGMGDNIYLGDRNGVRTPMQWSPDRNAGFSRADPQRLYLPPIMDPIYGYEAVNVEAQSRSPESLLNWTRRLITVRKAHKAFGRGTLRFLRPGNRKILAYVREYQGTVILCVANLARSSQPVELDLAPWNRRIPVELIGNTSFPPIGELPYLLTLPAWGFYWFLLSAEAPMPAWHVERPILIEQLPVLVIPEGLMAALSHHESKTQDIRALMARRVRDQLERDVLPAFLAAQRWFAGKGTTPARTTVVEQNEWHGDDGRWLLALLRAEMSADDTHFYALPFSLAWEDREYDLIQSLRHATVARVRQRARMGVIYDAFWDDGFCRSLVKAMARNEVTRLPHGELRFSATRRLTTDIPIGSMPVNHPAFEQSNTLVVLDEAMVLKGYRRLRRGLNPEIEVGRFLTDVSPFEHIAPVLGTLEYHDGEGDPIALAVVHGFVRNQGSGWNYTVDHLRRFLDDTLARPATSGSPASDQAAAAAPAETTTPAAGTAVLPSAPGAPQSSHAGFLVLMQTLGRRTGELHAALAKKTGDAAFDPEPITPDDLAALRTKVRNEAAQTLDLLASRRNGLPAAIRGDADRLLASRDALLASVDRAVPAHVAAMKTRYHGDYHLGQVLLTTHDFVIVDFEGEPSRSLGERRAKHSPLRDVAGMLRSFGYAAAVALDQATAERAEDRARLASPLAEWRAQAADAFLSGYRQAIRGVASYPADATDAVRLIGAFTLEKALYELRYELTNRPDWVRIPLSAVLEHLSSREKAP